MNTVRDDRERCALESINHIQQKVCLMWGTPELDIFISRLIMDSRDGQRQGLPVELGAELLFLAKTNKIVRAINLALDHKVPWKEALQQIEAGDQKRLEADALDNPLVSRDTVIERRSQTERRAAQTERRAEEVRRTGVERRQRKPTGVTATFGHWVFSLITSRYTLFLIAAALTLKLAWPYLNKVAG